MTAFNSKIPFVASPNFSSRRGLSILGTVIHYTGSGGSADGDIKWFLDPASKVSAHFVIGREGDVTQMVPLDMAAWHAGPSEMELGGKVLRGCNLFTIGIELDNCGFLYKGDSGKFFWEVGATMVPYRGPDPIKATLDYGNGTKLEGWWEPYAEPQIDALTQLLTDLHAAGHHKAVQNLVGHEEVAVPYAMRKRDPGPLFPWQKFARKLPRKTSGILAPVTG